MQLFKSMHVQHLNFSSHSDLSAIGILNMNKSHSAQKAPNLFLALKFRKKMAGPFE